MRLPDQGPPRTGRADRIDGQRADGPVELREKILADYFARPVPQ